LQKIPLPCFRSILVLLDARIQSSADFVLAANCSVPEGHSGQNHGRRNGIVLSEFDQFDVADTL
jgi:hypothetical protein